MSINEAVLYVVATPIGNLADMSPRALQVLSSVNVIAAEDTRHSARLLRHYGIKTPCLALHEHNERGAATGLVERLLSGQSIALITDAGTPLISDPGYHLVSAARTAGIKVSPIAGPCALITALSASGLPSDRFVFEGFLPVRPHARRTRLEELQTETRTLIFYEAPHRILECIKDLAEVLGKERQAVVAREFVIVVRGSILEDHTGFSSEAERIVRILMVELPLKQAAALAAQITGLKKNALYDFALRQKPAHD